MDTSKIGMGSRMAGAVELPDSPFPARTAKIAEPQAKTVQPTPNSADLSTNEDFEQTRFDAVKKAVEVIQRDVFAVSDSRFTIYKDTTGQYITRFTSLRDGSVTYYPEAQAIKMGQRLSGDTSSLISTQA